MNKNKKRSQCVGFGLILGVAIGSALDFIGGSFSGITTGIGAGLGILAGAICYYYKLNNKSTMKNMRKNWQLGFFGFFALFAIQPIIQGEWTGASWLVWLIWFIYFIPKKRDNDEKRDK
jgi:hypothetical protein